MNEQLKNYVSLALASGKSKESIYQALLAQGWHLEDISQSFSGYENLTTQKKTQEDAPKHTINILVTIGAILVGLGIFSFVASNWEFLSSTLKVIILLISLIVANVLGWYFKEKKGFSRSGSALYLLGGLIYGASIFLIGQIFQVRANWPDAYMLWMLGVLVMGFALEFSGLFYLGVVSGLVSVVGTPIFLLDSLSSLGSFSMTPIFLLVVCTIVTAYAGWVFRKKIPEQHKGYF